MTDSLPVVVCYALDNIERETTRPIAQEFAHRYGWRVQTVDDLTVPADIGIYACHGSVFFDFERHSWDELRSSFSVMVVHDFDQHAGAGIRFFAEEGWGRFDLGLVPGPRQLALAHDARVAGLALPRFGVSAIGWPKSDSALRHPARHLAAVRRLRERLSLGNRRVVLLACSWSKRQHLEDLLAAADGSDVDIVVRYPVLAPASAASPWFSALEAAREELDEAVAFAHEQTGVRVTGPETDLYASLSVADVVVSNGSNVVYEAVLMGTPVVSVSTWLHRAGSTGFDTVAPHVDLGGVGNCTSAELGETLETFLTEDLSSFTDTGRETLIPPETVGRSAEIAVDRINEALARRDELPALYRRLAVIESALARARSTLAELEQQGRDGSAGRDKSACGSTFV